MIPALRNLFAGKEQGDDDQPWYLVAWIDKQTGNTFDVGVYSEEHPTSPNMRTTGTRPLEMQKGQRGLKTLTEKCNRIKGRQK